MEVILSPNGKAVLKTRYLRKDPETGKPIETIAEMIERITTAIASAHATTPEEKEKFKSEYHGLLDTLRFMPNTPVFTGAGTPLKQLAACFVLPIADDLGRLPDSIFNTLKNAALIQQSGGGVGFSFGRLRHRDDIVAKSAGRASGPVSFMEVYDTAFGAIAQGGCLTMDTLVHTEFGTLRLDEIIPPDLGEGQWCHHNIMVSVPEIEGPQLVLSDYAYNNGPSPLVKVTLGSGITLTGTPDHKFHVMEKDTLKVESWKELRQMVKGDLVISRIGRHVGSYQRITAFVPTGYPTMLCEKLAFIVGVINQCGSLSPETGKLSMFCFLSEDSHSMGMVREINDIFSARIIDTVEFTKFFLENKLMTVNGGIPLMIRKSPPSVVAAFMRGYFEAGQRAYTESISVCTNSPEISQEIAVMLRGIGVPADVLDNGDTVVVTQRSAWFKIVGVRDYSRFKLLQETCIDYKPPYNDIVFDFVEKVEYLSEPRVTGCIKVRDIEAMIANGVGSANSRRGASMGVLPVDHPDISEFISCKVGEDAIKNFNISVGITDRFMEQCKIGEDYDLISPRTHQPVGKLNASELMDAIAQHAYENGEPGVLFLDRLNQTNPLPHLYHIETTNPCGEQALGPYENCCLGSINLARHYYYPAALPPSEKTDKSARIDWKAIAETVRTSVRFLDDVVTANGYVDEIPQLRVAALAGRRIGLGIMGLADLFFAMHIRYGSVRSLIHAALIAEWIQYNAMLESIELAKTRGPFPAIKGSIYDPDNLTWVPPREPALVLELAKKPGLMHIVRDMTSMPYVNWSDVVDGIKKFGIRNCAVTTVAPTGTIGTVAGVEGYGIEPAFALSYTRFVIDQATGLRVPLKYASPLFASALEEFGISADHPVIKRVLEEGSFIAAGITPTDMITVEGGDKVLGLMCYFVTANDINPQEHVRMQAVFQNYFSNSISKTVNLPFSATPEQIREIYQYAWECGCRGITVYRNGSREVEVVSTGKKN